ncbi:hypothetical protein [Halarcobacter anaerophilus]|uniref:hypothetical protein n=1 Tax=Halarcobacter anaerophilus TaxID=877500 RepID=UPI000A02B19C|nr:hypothetical protein [Halarcobacter anaerophilus]
MTKYFLIFLLTVNSLFSLDLNNLLKDIQNDASVQIKEEQKRLNEFKENESKQKQLLNEAKAILSKESKKSERLKTTLDKNEELLMEKETLLNQKMGDLGEMFGSVRQTSADFLTNFQASLTASHNPQKEEVFEEFANSKNFLI